MFLRTAAIIVFSFLDTLSRGSPVTLDLPSLLREESSRLSELKSYCEVANQKFEILKISSTQASGVDEIQAEFLEFLESAPEPALTLRLIEVYFSTLGEHAIKKIDFDLNFIFDAAQCSNRNRYLAFERLVTDYSGGRMKPELKPRLEKLLRNYLSLESYSVFDPIDSAIRAKMALEASALNLVRPSAQVLLIWKRLQVDANALGHQMLSAIQSLEDLKPWNEYSDREKEVIRDFVFKSKDRLRNLYTEWESISNTPQNRSPFKSET